MKASEMREKTASELVEMERDLARELWNARFQNFTNQLDNTSKIGRVRRDLARIKTIMTEAKKKDAQDG